MHDVIQTDLVERGKVILQGGMPESIAAALAPQQEQTAAELKPRHELQRQANFVPKDSSQHIVL